MNPALRRAARAAALGATLSAMRPAAAQTDSARGSLFTRTDAWLAAGFAGGTLAVMPVEQRMARRLELPSVQGNRSYANAATVFRNLGDPGTVIISGGLYVAGRLSHEPTITDIGLHSTEAIAIASVAGVLIKGVAGRARPSTDPANSDDYRLGRGFGRNGGYQSMPSGHTLAAFALASEVSAEAQRRWPNRAAAVGVLTYSAATLTGFSRMYNNAHWASDVVVGAGIGTITGIAVARYQHSTPGNWVDRVLQHLSVAP